MINIKTSSVLHLAFIFLLIYNNSYSQISIFPGAEGFGVSTPGGRGGKIIKVTNLHDSGPGSLRAAIEADGPRIVIFEVAGIIDLHDKLVISDPFITIAGQTAPSDGICIRGEGLLIKTHDVVLRYLRIRPGSIDFGDENEWGAIDAITIGSDMREEVYNIVIDHCSLSWSIDEIVGIWNDSHDITIQYCIISEALHDSKHPKGPHGMGMLVGKNATNISIHHNLFAHNYWRNPLINGETFADFRNNIIYNAGGLASHIDKPTSVQSLKINYVGNYVIKGPDTQTKNELSVNDRAKDHVSIFIENNLGPNVSAETDDNWNMVKVVLDDPTLEPNVNKLSLERRATSEYNIPAILTTDPKDALKSIFQTAGAVFPVRDPIDSKIINDVKQRTGRIVNNKSSHFDWPGYGYSAIALDSDDDGMPDFWEEKFSLSPHIYDSNGDLDKDGYLNIEEYLNNTDPTSKLNIINILAGETNKTSHSIDFTLNQNYPNPVSAKSSITFEIPKPSEVYLKIINSKGNLVSDLVNGFMYEGKYEIIWDTNGLPPDSYMIYLKSGKNIKTVKAVILN